MDREPLLEAPPAEIADAICQLQALVTAATAAQCELIDVFDSRELYLEDGAPNSASWLCAQLALSHSTASRLVATAVALRDLPTVAARFSDATLSPDQVRVIARVASTDDEVSWIEHAERLSVAGLQRLAASRRGFRREEAEDELAARSLVFRWDADGRHRRLHGRLPAAEGTLVQKALERIVDQLPVPPEGVAQPTRMVMADALVELASMRLAADPDADRATVEVHVDADGPGSPDMPVHLEGPGVVAPVTAERLAWDARLQPLTEPPNQSSEAQAPAPASARAAPAEEPVAGKIRRTVPPWLRRFLLDRDDGRCIWPGCGHRRWLQHHHERPFGRGGPTVASNLVTLCGFHHRLVHEGGWAITRDIDGTIRVTRPDGRFYEPRPQQVDAEVRRRFPLLE